MISILSLVLYIFATVVQFSDIPLTGVWYHLNNLGVYGFTIIQFGLLVYAFSVVENNEINLESLVEHNTAELVSMRLKEHQDMDKLRRQHTQELITGARRLSEQINVEIEKPLKQSLDFVFLMKQNPDLYLSYADSIEESLEKISDVVRDIQNKTSVGELKKGFEDISELVQKAIDVVDKPDGIKVIYEPEFHALAVDPVKMFLVMQNLIENAIDFMGEVGVLSININSDDHESVISISDTGKGISEEDRDKIFTPFFTRKPNGLGLGLVYCKNVIQAHDGNITFDTGPDGTTFYVKLPKNSNYVL